MRELERRKAFKMALPPNVDVQRLLLAPYEIILREGHQTVELGRYSHGLMDRLKFLRHADDTLLFKAGAFCESGSASFVVGGEHRNDSIFNFTMGDPSFIPYMSFISPDDLTLQSVKENKPIILGHNVLVSRQAIVLSGAEIADGCVVGAAALVRGKTEPFGVYAGIPARRLRDRFSQDRQNLHRAARMQDVMAYKVPKLARALHNLEEHATTIDDYLAEMEFLPATPRICFDVKFRGGAPIKLGDPVEFRLGSTLIVDEAILARLRSYFTQRGDGGQINWTADIFDTVGLYD